MGGQGAKKSRGLKRRAFGGQLNREDSGESGIVKGFLLDSRRVQDPVHVDIEDFGQLSRGFDTYASAAFFDCVDMAAFKTADQPPELRPGPSAILPVNADHVAGGDTGFGFPVLFGLSEIHGVLVNFVTHI